MDKKQTAVEWLVNELVKKGFPIEKYAIEIYNQAKAMEKEQVIEANEECSINECGEFLTGEQYYTSTYE